MCAWSEPQQSCSGGVIDLAAVAREHFHGVAVDVAEDQVLGAADEHGDAILAFGPTAGVTGAISSAENLGWMSGVMGSSSLQAFGQELEHAAAADERLQPELLVEPQARGPTQPQAAQVHEQPAQRKGADEIALGRLSTPLALGLGAGVLEQFGVVDARRAGGHAGEAAEAEIHLVGERLAWRPAGRRQWRA